MASQSSQDDGIETLRLLACYAVTKQEPELAAHIAVRDEVQGLKGYLEKVEPTKDSASPETSLEEQFWLARAQKNWARLQDTGLQLVDADPETYASLLRQSLGFNPNQRLADKLESLQGQAPLPAESQSDKKHRSLSVPCDWSDWVSQLSEGSSTDLGAFLTERPDVNLEHLKSQSIIELANGLEELYLSSDLKSDQAVRQLLLTGLPELMQDFVNESQFPRDTLVPIYSNVFLLWAELKCGSTHPPDSQVLLNLADGVLTFQREFEPEVVTQFEAWWNKSPVKANLPFLLGIVDLLNSKGTEEQCGNFWITGATYLQNNPKYLTVGERTLWRQIGLQIFDQSTIDEYLPLPESSSDEVDPLKGTVHLSHWMVSLAIA